MRKLIIACKMLALSMAVASLVGCDHVVHGKIASKGVVPAGVILMPMTMYCGKGCMTTTFIPIFYPESYYISVVGPDPEGKVITETVYEGRQQWESAKDGDDYSCGGDKGHQCVMDRPQASQ